MKKFLGTILGSVVLGSIILGIITLLSWLVEWLCADMGRYILGLGIFIYILYRMFKSEFGE